MMWKYVLATIFVSVFHTGGILPQSVPKQDHWFQLGNEVMGTAFEEYLGRVVSMSGDGSTIVAGRMLPVPGEPTEYFVVMTYDAISRQWEQKGSKIDGDSYAKLSSDGNMVVVYDDNDSNGRVSVFKFESNDWRQIGSSLAAGTGSLPARVDMSADGSTIVISDPYDEGYGYVRVYKLFQSPLRWVLTGNTLSSATQFDSFGTSIAISANGTTLAIGTPNTIITTPGNVRVYKLQSSQPRWIQIGSAIDVEFGFALTVSEGGSIIGVGGGSYASRSNFVRVYKYSTDWLELGQGISGKVEYDGFGSILSMSADGLTIAVGAPYSNSSIQPCYVSVYKLYTILSRWLQIGSDIVGVKAEDLSGISVALSGDGTIVAVGSPGVRNKALRVNAAGQVRVDKHTSQKCAVHWNLYNSRTDTSTFVGALRNGTIITRPPP